MIGTIDDATAEQIANEDFPKSKCLALPQLSDFSQLLNNIVTGKADVTFTEPADAIAFQKHNPVSRPATVYFHLKNKTTCRGKFEVATERRAEIP